MHTISPDLLRRPVRIALVGCGGTGSAVLCGLPYLHQAMLANGHPYGLKVRVMDGDRVSPVNCVRQPFSESEIGLYKCVVLVNRLNMFWGVEWEATPHHFDDHSTRLNETDIVIGCVDSRLARAAIHNAVSERWSTIVYWLDIGNNSESGQFVLGQPLNNRNRRRANRLRSVAEIFPEIVDPSLDDDSQPSCSAIEALDRQHPFINQTLANHALGLLSRLFRFGSLTYHGGFVNLATGSASSLRIDPALWRRITRRSGASRKRVSVVGSS